MAGLDPEQDGPRTRLATPAGMLLQMPSADERYCGSKLVTSCPVNAGGDRPVIQGVYVLFDGATMSPVAVLDGTALTSLRTPAVSGLAVRHLAAPGATRVALFGAGVQAAGHVDAMRAVLDVEHIDVVGRNPARASLLVERIRAAGVSATVAGVEAVAAADVVVCATAASTPLFDGALVADHAVVVAIGSHDPTAREVDTALVRRSSVVVESRRSALAEAGDVVIPVGEGAIDPANLTPLADAVRGGVAPPHDRPRLFKGTGMPWEDLATAGAIADRVLGTR
ncbi:ornithine cyclodeaminase family protein [Pseudonocardia nigra]|uniref:ornithine cyclodeaminase family protein n=1 Tax=Pseudonocardia nigra TaxID=1921578 RepID=UPI001FEA0016|nr:ornithine cyclodeaminase family protein [Pseudonocardia nigra]